MKRRKPLQRKTPLRRRTVLKPVSSKRQRELVKYYRARRDYLTLFPICQVCAKARAIEINHRAGRIGSLLWDARFFESVCRACHNEIHDNPRWARANGHLLERCVALEENLDFGPESLFPAM